MAVAEASLSTVMVSMSEGFSHEIWLPRIFVRSSVIRALELSVSGSGWITPSTTHSGEVLPMMVEVPRMLMSGVEPLARALVLVTMRPATRPCSIWSMEVTAGIMISSALTTE